MFFIIAWLLRRCKQPLPSFRLEQCWGRPTLSISSSSPCWRYQGLSWMDGSFRLCSGYNHTSRCTPTPHTTRTTNLYNNDHHNTAWWCFSLFLRPALSAASCCFISSGLSLDWYCHGSCIGMQASRALRKRKQTLKQDCSQCWASVASVHLVLLIINWCI